METFTLSGEPSAIRASATLWGNFSTAASGAANDLGRVNTSEWIGDESDTYRSRMNSELVPHLDTTSQAWEIVKTALTTYAGHLESLQQQMATLRVQHGNQQTAVNHAQTAYGTAKGADSAQATSQQQAQAKLPAGKMLPPDTYHPQSGSALGALQSAQLQLHGLETKAAGIRLEHGKFVTACCGEIRRAKKLRPVHPPGFWDRVKSVGKAMWNTAKSGVAWAAKNLGPILKTISAVAGLLALIPCLTPIMGPIALVAGAAALTLDVLNKLMNGKGSWIQIGIDTLSLIPGTKCLITVGKVGKLAAATRGVSEASAGVSAAKRTLVAAKAAGTGIKDAKAALAGARTLNTVRFAENAALTAKYGAIDKSFTGIGAVTGVCNVGLSSVQTYRETHSFKQAALTGGIAALDVSVPGTSTKFGTIQDLVASGAALTKDGYDVVTKIRNGEKVTGGDIWTLTQDVAGGALKTHNTIKYRYEGRPGDVDAGTGQPREAYATPTYSWQQSRQILGNTAAGAALVISLHGRPHAR